MTPLITAENIAFDRGQRRVVDGFSLDVQKSEVIAITGPNGAGKSTILGLLAGDLKPTRGRVCFDGCPTTAWSAAELATRRAVVGQHLAAPPGLTALDVVLLGRLPWLSGRPPAAALEAALRALEACGIVALATRAMTTLSGGERQRVHLARALAQAPQDNDFVFFFDEPTASLDLGHADRAFIAMTASTARGHAIVAVVHDLALAARHADRVVLLAAGSVVASGSPRNVFTPENLAVAYGCDIEVIDRGPRGLIIMPVPPSPGVVL